VGVATGIQDEFSWNAVALAAVGGGVGGSNAGGVGGVVANSAFLHTQIRVTLLYRFATIQP
jgi:hypothetical protein